MITTWIHAFRKWQDQRRTLAALITMSDERLKDIGLLRGNLEHAVRVGEFI